MAVDGLSIDWRISMARARAEAGPTRVLAGNVDPMHLYGSEANIRQAVADCIAQAKVRHWGAVCVACVVWVGVGVVWSGDRCLAGGDERGSEKGAIDTLPVVVVHSPHMPPFSSSLSSSTWCQGHHVLNLGHGVEKDTPEENVAIFVDAAKHIKL